MGFMTQLFTEQELAALDGKELETLRVAILEQIQTSPEINGIVRKMLKKEPGSPGPA
jgi:hypothetical protein